MKWIAVAMRAVVIHEARDRRVEARETRAPGPREVRVRLAAGGVCGSDLLADAELAFRIANDRGQAMKAQIAVG